MLFTYETVIRSIINSSRRPYNPVQLHTPSLLWPSRASLSQAYISMLVSVVFHCLGAGSFFAGPALNQLCSLGYDHLSTMFYVVILSHHFVCVREWYALYVTELHFRPLNTSLFHSLFLSLFHSL